MFPACKFRISALTAACCCSCILLSQFLLSPLLQAADPTTETEKIIYSISDGALDPAGTIYSIDPDGSNPTKLFDFSKHPKNYTTGLMRTLRVDSSGQTIFFTSDNAKQYTPSRYNIFSIDSAGANQKQRTPGENSGTWDRTGTATVTGTVTEPGTGNPYGGVSVYLEGKGHTSTDVNGNFTFNNVDAGLFWLTGYRPGGSDTHESRYINVVAGLTHGPTPLIPNSGSRWSAENNVPYGDRIYHMWSYFTNQEIQYVNTSGTKQNETVLKDNVNTCGDFDAFDVGKKTGTLAILKYDPTKGCGGVYTADKDGKNLTLIHNMAADPNYGRRFLPRQTFWNPAETFIAFTAEYASQDYIVVINNSGQLLSSIGPATSAQEVMLYGWSPDGKHIFYSYKTGANEYTLAKYEIDTTGSILNSEVVILSKINIKSATWDMLTPPQSSSFNWNLFLPAVIYSTQ